MIFNIEVDLILIFWPYVSVLWHLILMFRIVYVCVCVPRYSKKYLTIILFLFYSYVSLNLMLLASISRRRTL